MRNLAMRKQAKEMGSEKRNRRTRESDWQSRCEMHIMEFLGVKISYLHSTIEDGMNIARASYYCGSIRILYIDEMGKPALGA